LEDIVVAKLYSYRDTDREDLTAPGVLAQLDWERLRYLATAEEEAKINALNERLYREFLDRYLDYEREYRPCET
jgi:hypothetical protein